MGPFYKYKSFLSVDFIFINLKINGGVVGWKVPLGIHFFHERKTHGLVGGERLCLGETEHGSKESLIVAATL